MHSKITRVSLKNYRSITSCDVELQPLTLLVGPNGSGKSNFLDSLVFLNACMHEPIEDVIQKRNGIRSILQKLPDGGSAESFSISVNFTVNDIPGTYSLIIGTGLAWEFIVKKEECKFGKEWFTSTPTSVESSVGILPGFVGNRPALVALGALPNFAPVLSVVGTMIFYSPDPAKMRQPTSIGSGRLLMPNSSNVSDVLEHLQRTSPEIVSRVRGYLSSFNPEFRDVILTETGGYRWLKFIPTGNPSGWSIPSSDVSDGTLRAFAILLAIFQAGTPQTPLSLIGLEEPETNLHPAAAGVLLDALLEAGTQVPIIASTHSADLLDHKDLPVTSIIALALRDGKTVIGPIDEAGKTILRNRLYTAGELMRSMSLTQSEFMDDVSPLWWKEMAKFSLFLF